MLIMKFYIINKLIKEIIIFLLQAPLGSGFSLKRYYLESTRGKNDIVSQPKDPKEGQILTFFYKEK